MINYQEFFQGRRCSVRDPVVPDRQRHQSTIIQEGVAQVNHSSITNFIISIKKKKKKKK